MPTEAKQLVKTMSLPLWILIAKSSGLWPFLSGVSNRRRLEEPPCRTTRQLLHLCSQLCTGFAAGCVVARLPVDGSPACRVGRRYDLGVGAILLFQVLSIRFRERQSLQAGTYATSHRRGKPDPGAAVLRRFLDARQDLRNRLGDDRGASSRS